MEKFEIQADPRHIVRSVNTAMQGNTIRALVELITNADDSYCSLEDSGKLHSGLIEIIYRKGGYCCYFAVRDEAEGMSRDDIKRSFGEKSYGAATSGLKEGKHRRGYFGQGAKDALAGMKDGRIVTIKDDLLTECRVYIEYGKLYGEIYETVSATLELRNEHKIKENGTIAYFTADPVKTGSVPRFDRVQTEIANNYMLRKIMTNSRRKVFLIDENNDERRRLRYKFPEGKEILSDDFIVPLINYVDFKIHISIWRSDKELLQSGEDRTGGLLIIDDGSVVLDISLFKYDNEPLASRFFGEVVINDFRELLKTEEAVLSEERDGLVSRHPFSQKLISEIEKRLELKIIEEKKRKQKEMQTKFDLDEANRYKKAFHVLNEIAKVEAESILSLGENPDEQVNEVPDGFCIYPLSAQITVGKRFAFQLRIDTKVVRQGSIIKIFTTCPKVKLETTEIRLTAEDGVNIIRKYITLKASEPNVQGIVRASIGSLSKEAKLFVVPEKELLLDQGMVFQPESVTLRPNKPRKVFLLVYVKIIQGGSIIKLSSDNEAVQLSKSEIIVNEADADKHVAKYELDIWGEGEGQEAMITAECEQYIALLEAHVHSKDETTKELGGMFSEPQFDYDPDPPQRTRYSAETGRVFIYVNFPSVFHYLGEECKYKKTLTAQVLIADLVAERCFYEIAKKKVETSGVLLRPDAKADKVQFYNYELSKKYGRRIHEALVDQNLLVESKNLLEEKTRIAK
ncbi:MAG: hypothetical protein V1799_04315 [bacterium]